MALAELVYEQVKALPDPLKREVLDFVTFLSERADQGSWRDLMNAQTSGLSSIWDNPEDAIWDDL